MAWLKEAGRVGNGLYLVAKESLRQASPQEREVQSIIKTAILTATDITGLTKGKIHPLSIPPPRSSTNINNNNNNRDRDRDSVVHFAHDHDQGLGFPSNNISSSLNSSSTKSTQGEVEVAVDYPGGGGGSSTITTTTGNDSQADSVQITFPPDANAAVVDNVTAAATVTATTATSASLPQMPTPPLVKKEKRRPRERRVPSTPFSRAIGFAGLGAGLAWGTLQESAKRLVFGTPPNSQPNQSAISPFLSEKNAERLALALCRMRGAALKLGQMLSIQDESIVPAPILAALDIVRQGADVMPRSQLNQVLDAELGPDWSSKLKSFDYEPMAAASIGQVHRAVTKDGLEVAMKIQYPGVANSIDSDIDNVKLLLDYTNLLPEKLYLDRAIIVAKEELSRECDYELEATNQRRFRKLLSNTTGFYVPLVVDDILSKRVLTTELVPGIPIDKVALLDQETRNYVGRKLLELTLMELFVFRFMQTDPNWSNFLYDENSRTMNLIDFGAARDYPKHFVDDYLRMVVACANSDKEAVIEMSKRLGFLTGMESEIMLEAHVQASFVVGLPFSKGGGYDFRSTNITQSLSNLGATMLRHRLTPPPDEAYSLHRKLSGAFLACIKLGSIVPCRDLLLQVHESYHFSEEDNGL